MLCLCMDCGCSMVVERTTLAQEGTGSNHGLFIFSFFLNPVSLNTLPGEVQHYLFPMAYVGQTMLNLLRNSEKICPRTQNGASCNFCNS